MSERIYRIHHRGSRFRGRLARLIIPPSPKRRPNNVALRDVETDELIICPWRGLRRVNKEDEDNE